MFRLTVVLAITSYALGAPSPKIGGRYLLDGRIIGGHDANITDYPYQLSLIYEGFGHDCGAVLISPDWALTGAHCTYKTNATTFSIRAGSSLRESDEGQLVQVSKIIQHPNFVYETRDSDISLIQLTANVTTTNGIPINISAVTPAAGAMANVTGWGITTENDNGMGSDVLQVVEVPIITIEDCMSAYAVKNEEITNTMLCAGYLGEGGKDACVGDSGGPIVVDGVLVGLVSWGQGCAEAEFPGVYTDVSRFTDWIKENSGI